jgi:hypothetical protein
MAALIAMPAGLLTYWATARAGPWARSRFVPFRGATFAMTGGGGKVGVVLTDIRDLRPVLRPADEKRFMLLFTAARDHKPADGIRRFRNDNFGEIDLFVSPIGQSAESLTYQVIINRL